MAMFNYESDEIAKICQGSHSSDTLYVAECKQTIIDGIKGSYPQLCEYEKEWLEYGKTHYEGGSPSNLEYQSITVNPYGIVLNAIPFHYKSAILKGQTVSNLWKELSNEMVVQEPQEGTTIQYDYSEQYAKVTFGEKQVNGATTVGMNTTQQLQGNKTYYINTFVLDGSEATDSFLIRDVLNSVNLQTTVIMEYPRGQILSFVTKDPTSRILFYYFANSRKYGGVNYGKPYYMPKRFIVSDKLEDVVNQDFFEGMKLVKMPVLRTTGKNLFDGEMVQGYIGDSSGIIIADNTGGISSANFIPVKPNTTYKLSLSDNPANGTIRFYFYDKYKNYVKHTIDPTTVFTTGNDVAYVKFRIFKLSGIFLSDYKTVQFQIEEGSVTTPYEPYKSNILTVNEPVELRGVGDVRDELDLLTGELTERIGEVVLDGSEKWEYHLQTNTNTIAYRTPVGEALSYSPVRCDRFVNQTGAEDTEHCFIGTSSFAIFINRSRLSTVSITGFKEYLQSNPLTIQYRLATESIKTVALSHQIKPYENTNQYEVSSDTIPPIGELCVPVVSTGAQTLNDILTSE